MMHFDIPLGLLPRISFALQDQGWLHETAS
jgi:hypothetical protein